MLKKGKRWKKYNVKIYTTSDDVLLDCNMDEVAFNDFLDFDDAHFVQIEDNTKNLSYIFNICHIICVEYHEIKG